MSLVVCLGIICSYAQDAPPQNAAAAAMPEIMSFAMTGELPGCKTYEYPAQKLSCGGHDFEAKAVAVYTYYPEKKRYGSLALQVYLKPLNTDRLPNSDSIAKYGGAGTQVYHECFEYDGVEKRIDGSADAYARVFSNHPPTDNEKLKLEYSAVFNADNPGESSIEYLLYESPWTKADEVVCSASYPKRYCQAEWRLDHLHNMGRYSLPNLREADYWDEAHLEATMFCFQEKDSVRPQGTAANSSFPGRKMELLSLQLVPEPFGSLDQAIDLMDKEVDGTFKFKVPEGKYVLFALVKIRGFLEVINGAPGANGPVLNHFNKQAVEKYLNNMSDKIQNRIGPLSEDIRSLFTDSMEL